MGIMQRSRKELKHMHVDDRFKKIEESLGFLHANKAEWEAYDKLLDSERSLKNQMRTAKKEGGLEKAIEIAKRLFDVLDLDIIAEKTGLSIADLEELKNKKN